jgi:hypothetical protein
MKRLPGLILAAGCAWYTVSPAQANDEISVTFDIIGSEVRNISGYNIHGEMPATVGSPTNFRGAFVHQQGVVEFDCLQFDRPDERYTSPSAINNHGTITGFCASGTFSFVRKKSGELFQFSVPGADQTLAFGINDHDQIVGEYINPFAAPGLSGFTRFHSFLRSPDGEFTDISAPPFPDDIGQPHSLTRTLVTGINNQSQLIGISETIFTPSNEGGQSGAFIYDNGTFWPLPDVPDGVGTVFPVAVNNVGQILVTAALSNGRQRWFLFDDDGVYRRINNPPGLLWLDIVGINDLSQLIGLVQEGDELRIPLGRIHWVIATPLQYDRNP